MPSGIRLGCAAALIFATRLTAQSVDIPGIRLVDSTVHGRIDTIAVTLREHGQYRVAVTPQSVPITVHATAANVTPPFVVPERANGSSSARYEIYPRSDGRFLVVVGAGVRPVHVVVFEDTVIEAAVASRVRRRVRVGFGVMGGVVSGYTAGEDLTGGGGGPRPGSSNYVEGTLIVRTSPRFTAEIGYGNDPRPLGYVSVNWFFGELQFARHELGLGGHPLDVALAFRYAQGNTTGVAFDRSAVSIGPMIGWHLDHKPDGRGVMVTLEPEFAYSFSPAPHESFVRIGAGLAWIP